MDDFLIKQFLEAGQLSISRQLLDNYHSVDLTNDELLLYLQIESMQSQGVKLPSAEQLSARIHWSTKVINNHLKNLKDKNFMTIDSLQDRYDFSQLILKIIGLNTNDKNQISSNLESSSSRNDTRQEILDKFQVEFGRVLSPTEIKKIIAWSIEDKFDPEMIELALNEAVLNDVRNLNYIEKILLNWQKQGVLTAKQAQIAKLNFQQKNNVLPNNFAKNPNSSQNVNIPLDLLD